MLAGNRQFQQTLGLVINLKFSPLLSELCVADDRGPSRGLGRVWGLGLGLKVGTQELWLCLWCERIRDWDSMWHSTRSRACWQANPKKFYWLTNELVSRSPRDATNGQMKHKCPHFKFWINIILVSEILRPDKGKQGKLEVKKLIHILHIVIRSHSLSCIQTWLRIL